MNLADDTAVERRFVHEASRLVENKVKKKRLEEKERKNGSSNVIANR